MQKSLLKYKQTEVNCTLKNHTLWSTEICIWDTEWFNKIKDKNNIISIDAESAFDKIQYPFLVKKNQQIGTDRMYHSKIKWPAHS